MVCHEKMRKKVERLTMLKEEKKKGEKKMGLKAKLYHTHCQA